MRPHHGQGWTIVLSIGFSAPQISVSFHTGYFRSLWKYAMVSVHRVFLIVLVCMTFCNHGLAQVGKGYSLGLTPKQMEQRWNQCCQDLTKGRCDLQIVNLKVKKILEVQLIDYLFKKTKTVSIWGDVNPSDGTLYTLGLGGTPVSNLETVQLFTAWSCLIKATNPTLSYPQVYQVLKGLGFEDRNPRVPEGSKDTVVKGIRYEMCDMRENGVILSAHDSKQPKEETRTIDEILREKK